MGAFSARSCQLNISSNSLIIYEGAAELVDLDLRKRSGLPEHPLKVLIETLMACHLIASWADEYLRSLALLKR